MSKLARPWVLGLATLFGCGAPTRPTPTQAAITMTQDGVAQVCLSGTLTARLRLPLRLEETAGLDADINFVRVTSLFRSRQVDQVAVTANDFLGLMGTNHIRGGTAIRTVLTFDLSNATVDAYRVEGDFVDAHGNRLAASIARVEVVQQLTCTI